MQKLERNKVLLHGIAGEVGRSFYWLPTDYEGMKLSATEILFRANFPFHQAVLRETEKWLTELSGFNAFAILDLFYIEQRLGCWAAPQHYGNQTSMFELSPFNHRRIFSCMMRLPYEYRRQQELSNDICRDLWPELLDLPFNEFTGAKKYAHEAKNYGFRFAKKIMKRIM
jgi:hypothetical protein